ncbi:MAG: SDR family NAD(P)-dependent oxidoreductase, partial [Pseudomonadales bacterium]|nr:SDR family NAD(P)-dependent oxidoreductase [Pseudomonadales bacterium]
MSEMQDKLIIVTVGARGQGEAEAQLFAREGGAVLIADVLVDEGEALAASLRQDGSEARFERLDVADPEDWEKVVGVAREWKGRIDVLINNA